MCVCVCKLHVALRSVCAIAPVRACVRHAVRNAVDQYLTTPCLGSCVLTTLLYAGTREVINCQQKWTDFPAVYAASST
jgi:hypothetical protein